MCIHSSSLLSAVICYGVGTACSSSANSCTVVTSSLLSRTALGMLQWSLIKPTNYSCSNTFLILPPPIHSREWYYLFLQLIMQFLFKWTVIVSNIITYLSTALTFSSLRKLCIENMFCEPLSIIDLLTQIKPDSCNLVLFQYIRNSTFNSAVMLGSWIRACMKKHFKHWCCVDVGCDTTQG